MQYHTIIIGAGASGVFCAIQAKENKQPILILDNGKDTLRKVAISGGGNCNVTNINTSPKNYTSATNTKFINHALNSFSADNLLEFLKDNRIEYHEKHKGQIFCSNKADDLIEALESKITCHNIDVLLNTNIKSISRNPDDSSFTLITDQETFHGKNIVVATGGISIPAMGATDYGYSIAKQFGLQIIHPTPALVPFIFDMDTMKHTAQLSGISLPVTIKCKKKRLEDDLLFTHQGISGPAALKISNHWQVGQSLLINFLPHEDISSILKQAQQENPKRQVNTILGYHFPKTFANWICTQTDSVNIQLANLSHKKINEISLCVHQWNVIPMTTRGFQMAEVTMGGVSTRELNPRTFECNKVSGLFFIGEVMDITGSLGGYNLQWAWSSAYVCGKHLASME